MKRTLTPPAMPVSSAKFPGLPIAIFDDVTGVELRRTTIADPRESFCRWHKELSQGECARPIIADDATADLLTAAYRVRKLLADMSGHWPGCMSIDAREVSELIEAAIIKAEAGGSVGAW